jgi:hypothetical protein
MQSRHIVITLGAAAAAFAVAFGLGKATSGSEAATGGQPEAAQSFDLPSAEITAAPAKADLPALKPKPKPKPTATPEPTAPTTPAPAPSTPSTPAPVAPAPAAPAPAAPAPEEPVSGVVDDG